MLTKEQIEEIKARLSAISSGQWEQFPEPTMPDSRHAIMTTVGTGGMFTVEVPIAYFALKSDADFIVRAPGDIKLLLDEIERLNELIEEAINLLPTQASTELSEAWKGDE